MARRRDRPRTLTVRQRPPIEREFSAGGLVYRRRGGETRVVLVARRRDGVLVWTIPKGHVERGEKMVETALREVREETGLAATIDAPLGDVTYWYARHDGEGRPVRVLKRVRFFLMRHGGGRFADRDDEMDAVRWFPLAEALERVAFANERALVQAAAARLAPR